MNVTLCSAFRNANTYIQRYFDQIQKLGWLLRERGDCLRLIVAEGDSTDRTAESVFWAMHHFDGEIVTVNHGGPDYGSVVNAERFANIAKVCNAIWERVPQDADAVIFVESDLIWEPATMLALLDDLAHVPAVSPMVMMTNGAFYDVWAFRKNGWHFRHYAPYWDDDFPYVDMSRPVQLDSAGSCMAIRGPLARQLCWPAADVFVGLCRRIYELGDSVWLDPKLSVTHP